MKPLVALFLLVLTALLPAEKAPTPPAPNAWVVRMFQFDPLQRLEFDKPPPPEINTATPAAEVVAAIKKEVKAFQTPARPALPVGSAALYDGKSGSYVIRTTARAMERVEEYFRCLDGATTRLIRHSVEIIQAGSGTIQQLSREAGPLFDHAPLLDRLHGLVPQGQAKLVGSLQLETRSGQRASTSSARHFDSIADFTVDDKNRLTWTNAAAPVGTTLEVETTLAVDWDRLDVSCQLEFHFAPPTPGESRVALAAGGPPLVVPATTFHRALISTNLSINNGAVILLGVWKPEGAAEFEGGEVMQAAFLRSDTVAVRPTPNMDLEKIFLAHVDAAVPRPENEAQRPVPPGMETRVFPVRPDFLSSSAGTPADPFGPADNPPAPPQHATPLAGLPNLGSVNAAGILKSAGIPFPEGASASFSAISSKLMVTNTPENLELVQQYVGGCCDFEISAIAVDLCIFESDGATVRQLARDFSLASDQVEPLQTLEKRVAVGKASMIQMARLVTRSGQKTLSETGLACPTLDALKPDGKGGRGLHLGSRTAGTRLEIEPTIGADGLTIDLAVELEHHFSPPTFHPEPPAGAGKTEAFISPVPEFHFAKVSTNTTVRSGMTRLVGVWQTDGPAVGKPGDLMQAAFITVHKVTPETDPKK